MKAIILDRDGVINHDSKDYIKSVDEWRPLPGSITAMADLYHAGYALFIATNQSGIARGLYSEDTMHDMHGKMSDLLQSYQAKVERIFFCPHHPDEKCDCRKPAPGLLNQLETHLNASVRDLPFAGDSLKDIQLAQKKACRPMLVRTGNGAETEALLRGDDKVEVFDDLRSVADHLLKEGA